MSAIFFTRSVSKCSFRSFSRATGTISLSVKSRAVSRIRRCSSVSSKSIKRVLLGRRGSRRVAALGGDVLHDRREALSDPDAHRRQAVAGAPPAQLPAERGEQTGARAAERVAERDRASVRVQLLVLDSQLARASE